MINMSLHFIADTPDDALLLSTKSVLSSFAKNKY
jgi:hypothetical protein